VVPLARLPSVADAVVVRPLPDVVAAADEPYAVDVPNWNVAVGAEPGAADTDPPRTAPPDVTDVASPVVATTLTAPVSCWSDVLTVSCTARAATSATAVTATAGRSGGRNFTGPPGGVDETVWPQRPATGPAPRGARWRDTRGHHIRGRSGKSGPRVERARRRGARPLPTTRRSRAETTALARSVALPLSRSTASPQVTGVAPVVRPGQGGG